LNGVPLERSTFAFTTLEAPSAQSSGATASAGDSDGRIIAPMPGKIVKIAVTPGATIEEHALLVVLEAMKMEHRIEAPIAAVVDTVHVQEGQIVAGGARLVELRPGHAGS